jgi:hypothetical protein
VRSKKPEAERRGGNGSAPGLLCIECTKSNTLGLNSPESCSLHVPGRSAQLLLPSLNSGSSSYPNRVLELTSCESCMTWYPWDRTSRFHPCRRRTLQFPSHPSCRTSHFHPRRRRMPEFPFHPSRLERCTDDSRDNTIGSRQYRE